MITQGFLLVNAAEKLSFSLPWPTMGPMAYYGPFWPLMAPYGPQWLPRCPYGPLCPPMAPYGTHTEILKQLFGIHALALIFSFCFPAWLAPDRNSPRGIGLEVSQWRWQR